MDINASIIDQMLSRLESEIREQASLELNISDSERLKSLAFLYLCVKTVLDLDREEAFECLTEGGGDFGIDAIHYTEENDGEFAVTVFQAKYKRDLSGNSAFPENGLKSLIHAIKIIFNPSDALENINARLAVKVEAVRSMIRDGLIPNIRVLACNNGTKWPDASEEVIRHANFGDQVTWDHINHSYLVGILQRTRQVQARLNLTGRAIVEDMNFSRVCIGRISLMEIHSLMDKNGELLLERNIRRYLGLAGNRVNEGIKKTIKEDPENFYFFNNGITLLCSDFSYNALQAEDFQVRVENLQIVNGGQTCMTVHRTVSEMLKENASPPSNASVLIRLYKLPEGNEDIISNITFATNSQNPVDLKDLRSNDEIQKNIESSLKGLGFTYRRKRSDASIKADEITPGVAAEAVLSVWRKSPHQAKFLIREHFGKLYKTIFDNDLNGAQVATAVLLYRISENRRKRPSEDDHFFVRYASCFIAMRMGSYLLADMKIGLEQLTHLNFHTARDLISTKGENYFKCGADDVNKALKNLYGEQDLSLQQLSATFRRGDLIDRLTAPSA